MDSGAVGTLVCPTDFVFSLRASGRKLRLNNGMTTVERPATWERWEYPFLRHAFRSARRPTPCRPYIRLFVPLHNLSGFPRLHLERAIVVAVQASADHPSHDFLQ